ncbi:MAG: hypothetical protein ACI9QL_002094 [Candidatus Omnitrophota bacterium]
MIPIAIQLNVASNAARTLLGALWWMVLSTSSLRALEPPASLSVPPGERPLLGVNREQVPGLGWLDVGHTGETRNLATTESVGDGAALMVYAPSGDTGRILAYDSRVVFSEERNDFTSWRGISFWYRGDGTDATGVMAWGENVEHLYRFPLNTLGWSKVFVPWKDFGPEFSTEETHSNLVLKIEMPKEDTHHYLLDHVRLFDGAPLDEARPPDEVVSIWPARLVRPRYGFVLEPNDLNLETSKGISFWVKPGGTTALGSLAWWGATEERYFFPLDNEAWQLVNVPWDKMPPRPRHISPERQHLIFSIQQPTVNGHYFILDRLHLYKSKVIEAVTPTGREDEAGGASTLDFLVRTDPLEPIWEKIRQRADLNLVLIGDSICVGANLDYMRAKKNLFFDAGFGARLVVTIAKHFAYKERAYILEMFDARTGAWEQLSGSKPVRSGFYSAILGTHGLNSELTPSGLERVRSYAPDIVIMQPGIYDVLYGTPVSFEKKLDTFVKALMDDNILVVLGTQTPIVDFQPSTFLDGRSYWEHGEAYAEVCRTVAERYQLPLVDVRKALEVRGARCLGDMYADTIYPNRHGHRDIGLLFFSMLTGVHQPLWIHVPSGDQLREPYRSRVRPLIE